LKKENKDLHTIHEVGKVPVHVSATKLHLGKTSDNYYIIEALHDLRSDVRFSHRQKVSSLAFLSTSIAHEMKNNLGAIRLILEALLDNDYKNVSDDDKKKYLLMAYNQLVETVKIPERLLKLAQYSENDSVLIDVFSAVKDMMLMLDYDAKRRGIEIITDIAPDLYFTGNDSDFKMVILNLAQNAIKAMPNGGILRVTANKSGKSVILNISDSGIGISADNLKHIFEPFYSANDHAKSSGLGLAIVKSLMEKAKGEISVKSKLQKGTRFTLKFPNAQKSPKS
ncbi:MAG: HAMP domain-containing histidine kinase, partial [Alphaproteobacteria bacterium]|nr:HAMP domain-containing histidine kinase [Alphaproteobacteria bacterium]